MQNFPLGARHGCCGGRDKHGAVRRCAADKTICVSEVRVSVIGVQFLSAGSALYSAVCVLRCVCAAVLCVCCSATQPVMSLFD